MEQDFGYLVIRLKRIQETIYSAQQRAVCDGWTDLSEGILSLVQRPGGRCLLLSYECSYVLNLEPVAQNMPIRQFTEIEGVKQVNSIGDGLKAYPRASSRTS